MISDYNDLNTIFNADKWLEENYGCEFYRKGNGFLNSSCPFEDHVDSSPSFGINTEKGFFKCFGCGREGSLIKLVQLLLNINFYQAINVISSYENISVDHFDSFAAKNEKFKKIVLESANIEDKNKRLVQKTSNKIKRLMKKDFDQADCMYKLLDEMIENSEYEKIKEMLNGIK